MPNPSPQQSFDPALNVVAVSHPSPVHLETQADIKAYFDAIVRYWRAHCREQRAYYLVNWNGFTTNMKENTYYAENVKRVVDECAILIVRYTDNPLQRAAARFVSLKLHVPSNTYATREDAVAVIEAHRAQAHATI